MTDANATTTKAVVRRPRPGLIDHVLASAGEGPRSVFEPARDQVYRFRYHAHLHVDHLVGGTPSDPKVAEGWVRSKFEGQDEQIVEAVALIIEERGSKVTAEEAVAQVAALKTLNGFKRDELGLYIEGRQVKACIKEASNIRWPKGRSWGPSRKGTKGFWAEHVFVAEKRIHLGVDKPTDIQQRFVSTHRGTGIQNEEFVLGAELDFTVVTDADPNDEVGIKPADWADMWVTAEQNGLGASRSQGYGTFVVTAWDLLR